MKVSRNMKDQLLKASSSIALNLAEGSGKRTKEDQRRYYTNALGSFRECEAILELEQLENEELKKTLNHLGGILFKLAKPDLNT